MAKHISVLVREEENQYWSEGLQAWVIIYANPDRGCSFRAEVLTKSQADDCVAFFVGMIKSSSRQEYRVVAPDEE